MINSNGDALGETPEELSSKLLSAILTLRIVYPNPTTARNNTPRSTQDFDTS